MEGPRIHIRKYNPTVDSIAELEAFCTDAYRSNTVFFGRCVGDIPMVVFYTRREFDEYLDEETPKYHMGTATNGEIGVFSPHVFGDVSGGIYASDDFPKFLGHEAAHIFINRLFGFDYPMWLGEGIPQCVSGRLGVMLAGRPKRLSDMHDTDGWKRNQSYPQAHMVTDYMVGRFGKSRVFSLCNSLGKANRFRRFRGKFEHHMGMRFEDFEAELAAVYNHNANGP